MFTLVFIAVYIVYIINNINKPISINPSVLVIAFPVLHIIINIIVIIKQIGISNFFVLFCTTIGLNIADTPKIKSKFTILLPIIFPTAISEYPSIAEVVLINNSGIDVPIDIIVKPITISGI